MAELRKTAETAYALLKEVKHEEGLVTLLIVLAGVYAAAYVMGALLAMGLVYLML